ncbi:sel1 repeat family protein [Sulfurimonas sp. MAG313]|nr:tetratricopeptide repeat protein [Sulfurimonas sp. MAG313]MDF1880698.1 sel1 repeat family protein [Sulfurimonas sp. MAG313]
MKKLIKSAGLTFVFIFVLNGCGSGSDSPSVIDEINITTPILQTAYLIDSPIEGVVYKTSNGISNFTKSDGSFSYYPDGIVTFSLGGLILGSVSAVNNDKKVFIQDMVGISRANTDDTELIKVAALLQTLDTDSNSSNGIRIDDVVRSQFQNENFALSGISYEELSNIITINSSKQMKNLAEIITHIDKVSIENGIDLGSLKSLYKGFSLDEEYSYITDIKKNNAKRIEENISSTSVQQEKNINTRVGYIPDIGDIDEVLSNVFATIVPNITKLLTAYECEQIIFNLFNENIVLPEYITLAKETTSVLECTAVEGIANYMGTQDYPKDYNKSFLLLKEPAELGYVYAQYVLGNIYLQGSNNFQIDYAQALFWTRLASNQKNSAAQNSLGNIYRHGQGVEQDFLEAIVWFKLAADQEDATAQYNMGIMNDFGYGIAVNYTKAVYWYTKAAEQEYDEALNNLGYMYEKGYGIDEDNLYAFKLYHKAALVGNSASQNNLGSMYYLNQGVEHDFTQALYWFNKSADQGHATAQGNIGYLYYDKKNYEQAFYWLKLASDAGSANAQNNLGILYYFGYGVDKNETKAFYLQESAAKQGELTAQYNIGYLYFYGYAIEQNYNQAAYWLKKAANGNIIGAQVLLGSLYFSGKGIEQDYNQSRFWYETAAVQGDSIAQSKMGIIYYSGYGIAQDYTKAYEWFLLAAAQEDSDAQYSLGLMHYLGNGVTVDYVKATYWFKKSAQQGDTDSQNFLDTYLSDYV